MAEKLTVSEAELKKYLLSTIRNWLKGTKGTEADLSSAVIWLKNWDERSKTAVLGLAFGTGVGCSPFCGCLARQITERVEEDIKKKFSGIDRVRGEADLPSKKVLEEWNQL